MVDRCDQIRADVLHGGLVPGLIQELMRLADGRTRVSVRLGTLYCGLLSDSPLYVGSIRTAGGSNAARPLPWTYRQAVPAQGLGSSM